MPAYRGGVGQPVQPPEISARAYLSAPISPLIRIDVCVFQQQVPAEDLVEEPADSAPRDAAPEPQTTVIVLSGGGGMWDTADWAGYGSDSNVITLEGVTIEKPACAPTCVITREEKQLVRVLLKQPPHFQPFLQTC